MTKRCKNCGWPNDDNCVKCQKCNAPLDGGSTVPSGARATSYEAAGGHQPASGGESLRKTVSENCFFDTDLSGDQKISPTKQDTVNRAEGQECPVCHYQIRQGVSICPNCGTSLADAGKRQPQGKPCPKCGGQNAMDAKFCNQCGASMTEERFAPNIAASFGSGPRSGTVNPWMQPSSGTFCTLKPIAWEGENIQHQALSFSGNPVILNRANTDPNNQSITSQEQAELTCENDEWYIIDKSQMHTTYVMASRKMKLKKGDIIILGNRLFEFN